uniref:Ig-like domain-containing protein n=1 Tax=Dicentrarchus labrax TaxID=13489 RepID=A0A8C4FC41_DICLA
LDYTVLHITAPHDQVHQTPADMYNTPGGTAEINCSHSIQSYDRILWYKQTERQLQFLGYLYFNNGYPETGVKVKIAGSANKDQNCTLTIEELQLNSSAVYFCAARLHSATYHCSSVQKPPQHILSSRYYSSQPLAPVCFHFMRW